MSWFNYTVKKMDVLDVGLVKWTVLAFALFIIGIWPAFTELILSVNPWCFFTAAVVFAIRPFYRMYIK